MEKITRSDEINRNETKHFIFKLTKKHNECEKIQFRQEGMHRFYEQLISTSKLIQLYLVQPLISHQRARVTVAIRASSISR